MHHLLSLKAMRCRKNRVVVSRREASSVWLTVIGILVGLTFALWLLQRDYSEPFQPEVIQEADLTFRIADLAEGRFRVFAFMLDDDTTIPFFIRRGSGNTVKVAFAACRRCFNQGIVQSGNQLLCRHCRRPMRKLGVAESPVSEPDCTEIPLPYRIVGENVIVARAVAKKEFRRWFKSTGDAKW